MNYQMEERELDDKVVLNTLALPITVAMFNFNLGVFVWLFFMVHYLIIIPIFKWYDNDVRIFKVKSAIFIAFFLYLPFIGLLFLTK